MLLRLLYGANASDRDSNAFLQTLAGFVYIPSYDMPMACRTHNLQAEARRIIITVVVTVVVVAVAILVVVVVVVAVGEPLAPRTTG